MIIFQSKPITVFFQAEIGIFGSIGNKVCSVAVWTLKSIHFKLSDKHAWYNNNFTDPITATCTSD